MACFDQKKGKKTKKQKTTTSSLKPSNSHNLDDYWSIFLGGLLLLRIKSFKPSLRQINSNSKIAFCCNQIWLNRWRQPVWCLERQSPACPGSAGGRMRWHQGQSSSHFQAQGLLQARTTTQVPPPVPQHSASPGVKSRLSLFAETSLIPQIKLPECYPEGNAMSQQVNPPV